MFKQNGDFEKLCLILNYQFRNKALLAQALTTKAARRHNSLKTNGHHDEMAFFGDGILRMVVDKVLIDDFPYYTVGQLSKTRDLLVKNINLGESAKRLKLEAFIHMDERQTRACQQGVPKLLADTVEAIIYAIYKDSNENLLEVKNFIFSHSSIDKILKQEKARIIDNYESILMEILQGNIKEVQKLLESGCPVNFKFSWHSVHYNHNLEDPGATVETSLVTPLEHILENTNEIAYDNSSHENYLEIIKLLLQHEANLNLVPDLPEKLFSKSLYTHDYKYETFHFIQQYHYRGSDLNNLQTYLDYRNSLLAQKSKTDAQVLHNQVIEIFYTFGCILDGEDYQLSITILQAAIIHGHSSTVDLLLLHKVNPNIQNKHGETALHLAALFSDVVLIQQLLNAGANPLLNDQRGLKPFEIATSDEAKKILLAAEIKYTSKKNISAIDTILNFYNSGLAYFQQQHYQKAKPLLERAHILCLIHGTQCSKKSSQYFDLLKQCEVAIQNKNNLSLPAINSADSKTTIHPTFKNKSSILIESIKDYLFANFVKKNIMDEYIMIGVLGNIRVTEERLKELLQSGEDTNQRDAQGKTALHIAVIEIDQKQLFEQNCSYQVIALLLEYGANSALRDNDNNFASHYTQETSIRRMLIHALSHPSETTTTPLANIAIASSSAPQMQANPITAKCVFFQRNRPNSCAKGNTCEFSHTL